MGKSYRWFVGVDWGGECHQVCVLDGQRNKIGERSIEHTGQGLAEFVGWLDEIVAGEPATMAAEQPLPAKPMTPNEAVERIRQLRRGVTLGDVSIKSLINEGRKY